jgi:TusA-related sulfurtransferase
MPSVKTALALEKMSPGQVIEVITDDPVSKKDLPVWAESTGNELLGVEQDGETIRIYLKKA